MNWKPGEPLPNVQAAEIDLRKFADYSMNPDNPTNQGKWMAFAAIGYDLSNSEARWQIDRDQENPRLITNWLQVQQEPQ